MQRCTCLLLVRALVATTLATAVAGVPLPASDQHAQAHESPSAPADPVGGVYFGKSAWCPAGIVALFPEAEIWRALKNDAEEIENEHEGGAARQPGPEEGGANPRPRPRGTSAVAFTSDAVVEQEIEEIGSLYSDELLSTVLLSPAAASSEADADEGAEPAGAEPEQSGDAAKSSPKYLYQQPVEEGLLCAQDYSNNDYDNVWKSVGFLHEIAHYYECGDPFSTDLEKVLDGTEAIAESLCSHLEDLAVPCGKSRLVRVFPTTILAEEEDDEEKSGEDSTGEPHDQNLNQSVAGTRTPVPQVQDELDKHKLRSVSSHAETMTRTTPVAYGLHAAKEFAAGCLEFAGLESQAPSRPAGEKPQASSAFGEAGVKTLLSHFRRVSFVTLLGIAAERAVVRASAARTEAPNTTVEDDSKVPRKTIFEKAKRLTALRLALLPTGTTGERNHDAVRASAGVNISADKHQQLLALLPRPRARAAFAKALNLLDGVAHQQQARSGSQKILFVDQQAFKRSTFRTALWHHAERAFQRLSGGGILPSYLVRNFVDATKDRLPSDLVHNAPAKQMAAFLRAALVHREGWSDAKVEQARRGLVENFANTMVDRLEAPNATLAYALKDFALWKHGSILHPAPNLRGAFAARRHAYEYLTAFSNGMARGLALSSSSLASASANASPKLFFGSAEYQIDIFESLVFGWQAVRTFGIYPEVVLRGYKALTAFLERHQARWKDARNELPVVPRPWSDYAEILLDQLRDLFAQQDGTLPVYYGGGGGGPTMEIRYSCPGPGQRQDENDEDSPSRRPASVQKMLAAECELQRAFRPQGGARSIPPSAARRKMINKYNDLFDLWALEPLHADRALVKHSGKHFSHYAQVQILIAEEDPELAFPMLDLVEVDAEELETGERRRDHGDEAVELREVLNAVPVLESETGQLRTTGDVLKVANADFAEDFKDIVLGKIFQVLGLAVEPPSIPESSPEGSSSPRKRPNPPFYVEIGVGPGAIEHNTRFLRTMRGWRGLLLDSHYSLPRVNLHQEVVTADNVVDLLTQYGVPDFSSSSRRGDDRDGSEFDLLSVDVDGADYHIVRAILLSEKKYHPKVVVVEHIHGYAWPAVVVPLDAWLVPKSSTAKQHSQSHEQAQEHEELEQNHPELLQDAVDERSMKGEVDQDHTHLMHASSARALQELLNAFGYSLVYYGDFDLIFVRRDELERAQSRTRVEIMGEDEDQKAVVEVVPPARPDEVALRTTTTFRNADNLLALCKRYKASLRTVLRDIRILDNEDYCKFESNYRSPYRNTHSGDDPDPREGIQGYSDRTLQTRFWRARSDASQLFSVAQLRDPTFVL